MRHGTRRGRNWPSPTADPGRDKTEARAAWSIGQACDAYLASPEFARKAAKTRSCDSATVRNHIAHHLRGEKLADLDVTMVRGLIREVETDTRRNSRKRRLGGAGASRKVVRVLSAVCTWAVGEGRLARNPIVGNLRLDGDGSREVVITEPTQYVELLAAMVTIGASLSFLFGRVGTLLGWRSAFVLAGILSAAGVLIAWAAVPRTEDAGRAKEPPPLLGFRPVLANRDARVLIVGYAAAIWGSSDCGSGSLSFSPSAQRTRLVFPRKPGPSWPSVR
jgi:hypothetical protein